MKGTIRQRNPGSWEIQVFLGRDVNGKRIRKTETVRGKKSDTQRRLREILSEVDRGAISANTRYRVGEWLDKWLDEKQVGGRREKTIDRYEGIIRLHLKPTLGRVELAKLSPMQIKDLELALVKGGMDPKWGRGGSQCSDRSHGPCLENGTNRAKSRDVGYASEIPEKESVRPGGFTSACSPGRGGTIRTSLMASCTCSRVHRASTRRDFGIRVGECGFGRCLLVGGPILGSDRTRCQNGTAKDRKR